MWSGSCHADLRRQGSAGFWGAQPPHGSQCPAAVAAARVSTVYALFCSGGSPRAPMSVRSARLSRAPRITPRAPAALRCRGAGVDARLAPPCRRSVPGPGQGKARAPSGVRAARRTSRVHSLLQLWGEGRSSAGRPRVEW